MNRRLVIILLILAPFFLFGFISALMKRAVLMDRLAILEKEKTEVETSNEGLRSVIKYFSLRANLEREARANLNLAKPGEVLVIFVTPTPVAILSPEPEGGIFQRLFDWIRR